MKRRFISFITAVSLLMGLVGVVPASADYSMNEEEKTFTWDFAEIKVPLRGLTGSGFISTDYNGLTISIADQDRIDHDKIDENGVYWSGGKNNRRYISYTPKEAGTLTVTGSTGTWGISTTTYSSSATFLAEPTSGVATLENCVAGTTYFIWSTANAVSINKVEYKQTSGEMTDSKTVKYDPAVEYSLIKGDDAATINAANSGNEYSIENNLISVKIAGTGGSNSKLSSSNGYDMYTDGYVLFTPDRDGKIVVEAVMRDNTSTLYMSTTGTSDGTSILAPAKTTVKTEEIAVTANTSYYLYNTASRPTSVKKITYTPKHQFYDNLTGSDDSTSQTYSWHIGNHAAAENKNTEVKQENNYAALTVSLGKGDFMVDTSFCNGIKFNGASVGNSGSIADSGRYIFVEPKYTGTFYITLAFIDSSSNDNRVFYHDLTSDEAFTASDYKKPLDGLSNGKTIQVADLAKALSSNKDKEHIRPEEVAKLKVDMKAGHKYVLYTFQFASAIYEMSYQYTTDLAIDYENEKLTGFVDGGSYTIGGVEVDPVNNELDIAEEYFGHTLEIGGTLEGVELTQSLDVAARPTTPVADEDYTVTQPTTANVKGSVAATAADTLEYKVDNGEWTSLTTEAVDVEQGNTVQIRKPATDSTFASAATEAITIDTIHTVTFDTDGGSTIEAVYVKDGETVSVPEAPTKEHYTFSKWQLNNTDYKFDTAVTGDITLKAVWEINKFTVTWENGSNTLETDENVEYNTAPSYDGTAPEKASSNTTIYTFSGWKVADENGEATGELIIDLTQEKITANTTYLAQFTETARKYKITFVDEDGSTVLKAETEYEYDATVTEPETPTKDATAEYTYTFAGWNPAVTAVSGDQTYKATYTSTPVDYTVSKANTTHGEISLSKTTAHKGEEITVTVTPENGYRLATLTVDGEDKTSSVTNNNYIFTMPAKAITVAATFEEIPADAYKITIDSNITGGTVTTTPSGSTTKGQTVTITTTPNNGYQLKAGSVMVNDGAVTVTDNTFTMPEENVTITAEFEQINYTITDNTNDAHGSLTISKKEGLRYGDNQAVTIVPAQGYELDTLTVDGVNVTASVNNNNYTIENITGNVTITATFKEIPVSTYTVTITGGEGIENVKLGEKTGTKNGNAYTFTDVEVGEYNFDVTYMEGYEKAAASPTSITVSGSKTSETISAQKKTYTITWNDDTNALIDTTTVEHGTVPTHPEPTKDATAQYTYTFAGWTPTTAAATANTTYTATFTSVVKKYTATFNLNGGNINGSTAYVEVQADYNTAPTPPENPIRDGYTFNGWSPAVSAITENTIFTAQWTENAPETVTVTFSAGQDGTLLGNSSKTITKGGTLAAGDIPAASKTGHTFDKWSDGTQTYTSAELAELSINSDTTFTATYTVNQYIITWNIEGAEAEEQHDYNTMPTYKNGTPQKAETAQFTYEFTTWSPALSVVTAAQTYTAQFSETKKKYNITKATVSNGNSFTVSAESIEWGETISITPSAAAGYELTALVVTGTTTAYSIGEGITKVGDTYTFTMPAENVTVTPTFEATAPVVQQYTVTYAGTATGGTYSVTGVTSGAKVDENAVITIIPAADTANGYVIDAVYAYHTGDARTEIDKITDNGGYKYIVTADTTVEVTFKKIKYTITWKNWNGETLTTTEVEHGTVPSYPNDAAAPAKDSDSEYDYTFDKWTPNLTEATAAAEYTATYTQVVKDAPKTFLNLLEGFSSWLKIEKTNAADSDDVVLTVSKDQESQNDIPTLTAYIAVYNNGVLQSVVKHDFVSNAVTLPAAEATGEYKIFIWADQMVPVIEAVAPNTTGANKLFD